MLMIFRVREVPRGLQETEEFFFLEIIARELDGHTEVVVVIPIGAGGNLIEPGL